LILAELITGKVPRGGKSYAEILDARVVKNEAYSIRAASPGIPEPFARVIDQLIDASAAKRQPTATMAREQLLAFVEHRAIGTGDLPRPTSGHSEVIGLEAPPDPPGPARIDVPIFEVKRKSKAGWVVAIVLLLAVGASAGYLHFARSSAGSGARDAASVEEDAGEVEIDDVELPPPPAPPPPPRPPPPPSKVPDPEPM
jgi:hypothetical protein